MGICPVLDCVRPFMHVGLFPSHSRAWRAGEKPKERSWAWEHGAPQLLSVPTGWGSCFILYSSLTQSILFLFSPNEHIPSDDIFIKLLIYGKYWTICHFYNLKRETLEETKRKHRQCPGFINCSDPDQVRVLLLAQRQRHLRRPLDPLQRQRLGRGGQAGRVVATVSPSTPHKTSVR